MAAVRQSQQAVRVLLELGASVKHIDLWWETAAQIPVHVGDIGSMRALVDAGLDFDLKYNRGRTILHSGVFGGKEMVELLLGQGGEKLVNDQDHRLQTPLHLAVTKGDAEVVKLLVRHGADTEVKDILGRTPMDWAISRGKYLSTGALLECRGNVSNRG